MALLISDLQGADFDVSLTGFEPEELENLFREDTKKVCRMTISMWMLSLQNQPSQKLVICGSLVIIALSVVTPRSLKPTNF